MHVFSMKYARVRQLELTCSFLLPSLCAPLSCWQGTPFPWLFECTCPSVSYTLSQPDAN